MLRGRHKDNEDVVPAEEIVAESMIPGVRKTRA